MNKQKKTAESKKGISGSLYFRTALPIVVLVFFLTGACIAAIILSGIVGEAEDSAEAVLREKSSEAAGAAGYYMSYKWSLAKDCAGNIIGDAQDIAQNNGGINALLQDETLSQQLLDDSFDDLVELLRKSGANEVFLILEGKSGENGRRCIYLRDLDPSNSSDDNSDILMKAGSGRTAADKGVSLDSGWTETIEINEFSDFYNKPLAAAGAAEENADVYDFGVWSEPSAVCEGDVSSIKYSLPLIGENGEIIGVLGTGVIQKTLSDAMPIIDPDRSEDMFYVLAKGNPDDGQLRVCWYFGPAFEKYYGNSTYISLDSADSDNARELVAAYPLYRKGEELVASVAQVELMRSSEDGEAFYIAAISEKNAVYYSRTKIALALAVFVLAGLAAAFLCAVIISKTFAKAARRGAAIFVEGDPRQPLYGLKTGIEEIDAITENAAGYAGESFRTASRYADIVRKADISFGVFDFNLATGMVFLSRNMFRLFGICGKNEDMTVGEQQFEDLFGLTRARLEQQRAFIRRFAGKGKGSERWVRLTVNSDGERLYGAAWDITEEMSARRLVEYERDHDSLTGLLAKNAFKDMLYAKFSFPYELKTSALLTVDLDDLKHINDTLGHDVGDEYIKAAAAVIKRYTNFNAGFAGMISGDEFQIFLSGADSKEQLRLLIGEFVRELSEASISLAGREKINVKASAGLAWYPDDSKNPDKLIKYSVFTKFIAKKKKKGGLLEFDREKYDREAVAAASSQELARIIRQRAVTFVFQPVVRVADGEIVGYEALMRPCSETLTTPIDLLRVARSDARLYEIEKLAFEKSFEQFIGLVKEGIVRKGVKLFINSVSNASLQPEEAEDLFNRYPEIYESVVLELREGDQIVDEFYLHKRRRVNEDWKGLIALDNFGTSYNNEFSLMRTEPDMAKIDMSIVRNINADESRQEIFSDLLSYCRKWGVLTAAVGIETREELETVLKMGVDYVQGMFIGRPSPIPDGVSKEAAAIISADDAE